MGLMNLIFSNKGNNNVGVKPAEQSPVAAFRLVGRASDWGPNKLPEGGVHSTVDKPEKVQTVNPAELGKMEARAQQRTENAERWHEYLKHLETISKADTREHIDLRNFQQFEATEHAKKLRRNEELAAFFEGQRIREFQEDRAWNALEQQHNAMTDELLQWNRELSAAMSN